MCRFARGFPDEELILWRAAGMRPRIDDQLAVGAQNSFAARDRVFDQRGRREVLPEFDDLEFFRNGKNDDPSSEVRQRFHECFPAPRRASLQAAARTESNARCMRWMLLFPLCGDHAEQRARARAQCYPFTLDSSRRVPWTRSPTSAAFGSHI